MCGLIPQNRVYNVPSFFFRGGPKKLEYRCIAGNLNNFCMNLTCRTYRQDGLQIPTYFHCFCWTGYVDQEVLNMISECSSQEIQHTEQREELDITNHELKDDIFFLRKLPVTSCDTSIRDSLGSLWIGFWALVNWLFPLETSRDFGPKTLPHDSIRTKELTLVKAGVGSFGVGCWLCNLKMIQNSKRYLL